jgi:hypothetical protein
MESVYHIVGIRVNEISWAHVWRLRSHYLGTGYDKDRNGFLLKSKKDKKYKEIIQRLMPSLIQ